MMVELKRYCRMHAPEGEQSVLDETTKVYACAICGVLNYAKKTLVEGTGTGGITQEQLDAAIAQHKSDAAAHHAAFISTDADAKITTHSQNASAHHVAFVGSDCDTKIATHTSNASAHHTAFVAADVAYLERLGMYGSANAEWVPLIFETASPDGDNVGIPAGAAVCEVSNVVFAAAQWLYGLALPPAKNQLKLYVAANGVQYYLSAANSTNYVTDAWLIGVASNGTATTIYTDPTDRNAAALVTLANSLTDLSGYEKVFVKLSSTQATANALKVKFVSMKVYYAT